MSLRIRLSRGGAKKRPFYRIVVAEGTSPRDGRFIERLGSYNPMVPKGHEGRLVVKEDRIRHWMSVGAKPTDRVTRCLQASILSRSSLIATSQRSPPRAASVGSVRKKKPKRPLLKLKPRLRKRPRARALWPDQSHLVPSLAHMGCGVWSG